MTTWRRPDWLGGEEVAIGATVHMDGVVYLSTLDAAGRRAFVPEHDLVEVRPPSIDDPVDLPLEVHLLQMKDQPQVTVRIAAFAHDAAAYLTVLGNDGHDGFLEGIISPEQCRDAARALWRLGTGGDARPEGAVAVQQPGTGAD